MGLVERAQDWLWSSATPRALGAPDLDTGPVCRPATWLAYVNQPRTEAEVERLQECLRWGRPFGHDGWMVEVARRLGLEPSLRPRGQPRKTAAESESLLADLSDNE